MQIGQVPIMFTPEAVVNDTRAITVDAETGQTLIPSLAPFAPAPVVVEEEATQWGLWATLGGLLLFAWLMASPPRG